MSQRLQVENKDFKSWMKIKEETHYGQKLQSYKECEIWWCKIGENIGNEICGKGEEFTRPVLVIHHKLGEVPESDYAKVIDGLCKLLQKNSS